MKGLVKAKKGDSMTKKKVLFLPVEGAGGSAMYRMVIPGKYLNNSELIEPMMESPLRMTTEIVDIADAVVLQRPASMGTLQIAEYAIQTGKFLIVDTDDLFDSVPDWSPASAAYQQHNLVIHDKIARRASLVTVTTPKLKKYYEKKKISANVKVLPNYVDLDLFNERKTNQVQNSDQVRVLWAGSSTHSKDFEIISDIMLELIEKYEGKLTFVVYGQVPSDIMMKSRFGNATNGIEYWGPTPFDYWYPTLHRINADIGLAPLVDIRFNHFKSPIKALEYGMLGIPVIASDVYPYRLVVDDGVNGYLVSNNRNAWKLKLTELIENETKRKEMGEAMKTKVLKYYDISIQYKQWETAYMECFEETVVPVGKDTS
jgi:glycosyltransferase involved in cell wall biosynthesis